jgi:hypothetical protein
MALEVTQYDLEELLLYSREFSEARERYDTKKEYIKSALDAGATVEFGVHTAFFEEQEGGGFAMPRWKTKKLVVR